jgi:hypothetical protein
MKPLETAAGATQIAVTTLGAPVLRRLYNHYGASARERAESMPGDTLVPHPKITCTRAITIDAPPAVVWAWLVQIGKGRAGLYSYDGLENLVGCDIHSADRLLPEFQHLEAGDVIRMGPEGYPCFRVASMHPPQSLVLLGADPKTLDVPPIPLPDDGSVGAMTWQWALRPREHGRNTRLVVRQRLTYPTSESLMWHVVEPLSFVMERRMLRGIKERAEASLAEASLV